MKSYLGILMVWGICGFYPAFGQQLFSVGVKAGATLATQTVDDGTSDYGVKPGLLAGGYIRYVFSTLALQMDVVYSQQGASIDYQNDKFSSTFKYINLPVILQYQVAPSWILQAGPQVGFLTCVKSDFHPVTHAPYDEQTYTKAYKKTDFGVALGGGWAPPDKKLIIELRYYVGLSSINDYAGVAQTKNNVLQLTLGYRLKDF